MEAFLALMTCLLVQAVHSQSEAEVYTSTIRPPGVEDEIIPLELTVNETSRFVCEFRALFTPEVAWMKEGLPLHDDHRFKIYERIVDEDSSPFSGSENPLLALFKFKKIITQLEIANAQIEDSGLYTCVLSNSPKPGFPRNVFNFTVKEPELIIKRVKVSQLTILSCTGTGAASSQAVWLKNGSPLPQDQRYKLSEKIYGDESSGSNPSELSIKDGRLNIKERLSIFMILNSQYEDSANYSCRIQDPSTHQFYRVYYQLIVEDPEPIILTTKRQESPVFVCQFNVESPSLIAWKKDGKPLPDNPRFEISAIDDATSPESSKSMEEIGIIFLKSTSTLYINNAHLEDSGIYTCIDENPLNYNAQKDITLQVIDPEIQKLEAIVGETAFLLCQFGLRYTPEIIWLKDGAPLPEDPRLIITDRKEDIQYPSTPANNPLSRFQPDANYNSVLQIYNSRVDDSAQYTCYVANDPKAKLQRRIIINVRDL